MLTELAFAFGRIVATEARGALKSILANLELSDEGDSSSDEPMYVVPGFYCRPMPPVEEGSGTGLNPEGECEVVALRLGDEVLPIGYRDLRLNSQVNPDEGEMGLAHYGGGFVSMKWNADTDGTNVTIYATRKDSGGSVVKASAILMDSADGNQHICLMHEGGQSVTLNKDDQTIIANAAGDTFVCVGGPDGVIVNSAKCALNAAVMLGDKDPAGGDAVMLSTALLAWIGEVNAALSALATHTHLATGILDSVSGACTGSSAPVVGVTAPTSVPMAATKVKGI